MQCLKNTDTRSFFESQSQKCNQRNPYWTLIIGTGDWNSKLTGTPHSVRIVRNRKYALSLRTVQCLRKPQTHDRSDNPISIWALITQHPCGTHTHMLRKHNNSHAPIAPNEFRWRTRKHNNSHAPLAPLIRKTMRHLWWKGPNQDRQLYGKHARRKHNNSHASLTPSEFRWRTCSTTGTQTKIRNYTANMLSASTITRTIAKGMQHFRDATKGMQSKKCNHRKAPNETRYTNMHNIGSRKFLFRHHSRRVTFKINDGSGTLSKKQ